MLNTLLANGPAPDARFPPHLFARFIGEWELEVIDYLSDGVTTTREGEWHFGWILDGTAIQDVWMVPSPAEHAGGAAWTGYGTAIRFFDLHEQVWRVTWHGVLKGIVLTLIASQQGDQIVQQGVDEAGAPIQWIFSDIEPNAFRWRWMTSADQGKTWRDRQRMRVWRK